MIILIMSMTILTNNCPIVDSNYNAWVFWADSIDDRAHWNELAFPNNIFHQTEDIAISFQSKELAYNLTLFLDRFAARDLSSIQALDRRISDNLYSLKFHCRR